MSVHPLGAEKPAEPIDVPALQPSTAINTSPALTVGFVIASVALLAGLWAVFVCDAWNATAKAHLMRIGQAFVAEHGPRSCRRPHQSRR